MATQVISREALEVERMRLARPVRPATPAAASSAPEPASEPTEARRNTLFGSTAQAASPAAAVELARAALRSGREAAAVAQEIIASVVEMGPAPEAATHLADHLQAEAEALQALALKLGRLAKGLHEAAEDLRPTPERQRAALAENLQGYKQQHLAMLRRAEDMLAGGAPMSAQHLVAAEACGLGRWRQAAVEAGWGEALEIEGLERAHKAFHRALAGLLFAHQQGRAEAAQKLHCELTTAAAAVAAGLDSICADVLRANDPAAGKAGAAGQAEWLVILTEDGAK